MTRAAIFAHVAAPAPRLLMRLALVPELLEGVAAAPRRMLEIGPGLGDLSIYLAARYPDATGVLMDISEAGIAPLQARTADLPRLVVRQGDFQALPDTERFDLVAACEVFEHIEDDEAAFAAVHRLLAPGGYFLFSVPAFERNFGAADRYAGHFRRYERAPLLAQFARHGFAVEQVRCYGFPLTQLLWPFYKFYYGALLKRAPLDMQASTKRSGTERSLVSRFARLPVATLMAPLFLCQHLVRRGNLGDGYLVLARKIASATDAPA